MLKIIKVISLFLLVLCFSTQTVSAQKYYRESWTEFAKNPAKLAAFRSGVAKMKARKPSDPRSWFFQAAIHGVSQDAIDLATQQDPDVANVDKATFWNQCPHNGQSSADFLIWHRAYLLYFERILRSESGDPNLSVPYWDYTGADRSFPREFADADRDPVTGEPRNPLYDDRREIAFMFGMYELTDRAVSLEVMNEKYFFGEDEVSGFAGGVADNDRGTQGKIERRPHNSIHFAVGGAIGSNAGLLAQVSTAAQDPIFWVHHANIDRLWSTWDCTTGKEWGVVPTQKWLEERPWSFYDQDLGVNRIARVFYLLGQKTFGISFASDVPNCKRLTDQAPTPGVPLGPDLLLSEKAFVPSRSITLGITDTPLKASAKEPVSKTVPIQSIKKITNLNFILEKGNNNRRVRRVFLDFIGMEFETPPSVGFEVYINVPENKTPGADSKYYAGTIALFGLGHKHSDHIVTSQKFDITNAVMGLDDLKNVRVTVVPFDLLKPLSRTTPRLLRDGDFKVKSMRIEVVESFSGQLVK